ncbi:MAG: type II toxin-antitoxin system RelE/ParE family toxin [Nitrospinae bacterium]|nr:type II toxin-antitoxin system RelE/ParE family toxin [Nitrospinota bacterium]
MSYQIEILPAARRELAALPLDARRRIDKAILALAGNPHPRPPAIIPLQGNQRGLFRLRIGDYRIIFQIVESRLIVTIIQAGHRKEIYRKFSRP